MPDVQQIKRKSKKVKKPKRPKKSKKSKKSKNIIQSNVQTVVVNLANSKRRAFKPKATSLQGQQSRHRMDILAMSRASELGRSNFQGMAEVNHFASQQRDRVGLLSSNIARLEQQVHRLGSGTLGVPPVGERGRSRLVPPSTEPSYGSSLSSSSLPPSAYTSLASLSDAGSAASLSSLGSLSDAGSRASLPSRASSLASLSDASSLASSLPSRASSLASLSGASSLAPSLAPSSVNTPLAPPRSVNSLASRDYFDGDEYKSYGELLEAGKTPVEANLIYSRQFDKPESLKSEGSQSSVREELQSEGSQSSVRQPSEGSQSSVREELQSEGSQASEPSSVYYSANESETSQRRIPLSRPAEPKPLLTKNTVAEINEQRYYDNIAEDAFGRRGGGFGMQSDASSSGMSLMSGSVADEEMRPTLNGPMRAKSDGTASINGSVASNTPSVKADLYYVS